jgi:Domain of Unknown Function (DUF748)
VLWLSAITLALVAACAIAMITAVPILVERALTRYGASAPERAATIERTRVNPFTLRVTLFGLDVHDNKAGIAFSAPETLLDFSIASLLARRAVFDGVHVEQPTLTIVLPLQLAALEPAFVDAVVEALAVRDGRLDLVDGSARSERRYALHKIRLDIADLDGGPTAAAGGRYKFEAADDSGARIDLQGTLAAGLESAYGGFAVHGLELDSLRPWLGPRIAAITPSGRLDLSGEGTLPVLARTRTFDIDARAEAEALMLEDTGGFDIDAPQMQAQMRLRLAPDPSVRIALDNQRLTLTDTRWPDSSSIGLSDVTGMIEADGEITSLTLTGRLAGAGPASLELRVPSAPAGGRDVALMLADVPAERLSPYATEMLGRAPRSGSVDIDLDYAEHHALADGHLRIRARELELDDGSASTPVELAAALLEDRDRVMTLDVPVYARNASGGLGTILATAVQRRIAALAAAPFTALSPLAGLDPNALGHVPFAPGAAALGAAALTTLDGLARALRERPRLGVRARGAYDARADRDALARQQIELHVLLATAGPSPQARPEPVDFSSPRAQDVLDEFAGERLSAARREAIDARFRCPSDGDAQCRSAYYAAVFDALVESESIAEGTLTRLARFRAQSIASALVERGIDAHRVTTAIGTALVRPQRVDVPIEIYRLPEAEPVVIAPQTPPVLND